MDLTALSVNVRRAASLAWTAEHSPTVLRSAIHEIQTICDEAATALARAQADPSAPVGDIQLAFTVGGALHAHTAGDRSTAIDLLLEAVGQIRAEQEASA